MTASENKLTEMKKTMKIAMQRFTDMKSMNNFLLIVPRLTAVLCAVDYFKVREKSWTGK